MQPKNGKNRKSQFSLPSEIKLGFTSKPVVPHGGLLLLSKFFNGLSLANRLNAIMPNLPTSNRAYKPGELLMCFIAAVFCGMTRLSHFFRNIPQTTVCDIMQTDAAKAHFVTIARVFKRIKTKTDITMFRSGIWELTKELFSKVALEPDWLVFDSTVLTRYGKQEKATKGYNCHKPGRKSHHPLIASLCEQGVILDIENRPGKAFTTAGIGFFLDKTFARAQSLVGRVIGVLADSGFYDEKFFDKMERQGIDYIVMVRFFANLKRKVLSLSHWQSVDKGIEIAEFIFKQDTWKKKRRYVAIRRNVKVCPDALGKKLGKHEQLSLPGMEPEAESPYRYSCFVTSFHDDAVAIWRNYRRRALVERHIEDLTYDFGFKKLNTKKWLETSAIMTMLMLSFNIYALFAKTILPQKDKRKKLSTIRSEVFLTGGVMGRKGRTPILRISVPNRAVRRRFMYLLGQIDRALAQLTTNCFAVGFEYVNRGQIAM